MNGINIQAFLETLKSGLIDLAKESFTQYKDSAVSDTTAFWESAKADIQDWTKKLADGQLSKDEYRFLVEGKKDLAEMYALTQAGVAAARLQEFRTKAINLVIDSAFSLIP